MVFELLDMDTGNLLGAWHSEAEALRFVYGIVIEHGSAWTRTIALVSDDELGRGTVLAEGDALLHRAMSIAA